MEMASQIYCKKQTNENTIVETPPLRTRPRPSSPGKPGLPRQFLVMTTDANSEKPPQVSSQTFVALPIAVIAGLIGIAAVSYAAWTSQVEKNHAQDRHFEHTDARVSALEADQRTTRELLIRIDEGVNQLKRERRIQP